MKLTLLILTCFLTLPALAKGLAGRHVQIDYDGGQSYRLDFEKGQVTWQGQRGPDAGKSETEDYRAREVSPDLFFLHWTERDRSFVDLVLDFTSGRAISSGRAGDDEWLREGSLVELGVVSAFPRVDAAIAAFDHEIEAREAAFAATPAAPNDTGWVKRKLSHMVDIDQFARNYTDTPFPQHYSPTEATEFTRQLAGRVARIDIHNTVDIKELMKIHRWFRISRFGTEAAQNAWLLVQHADRDPALQKQVLAILTDLYPLGEASRVDYAYLFDRVAASYLNPDLRQLQRYGTQGACVGPGKWEPLPVEDPPHLDQRRREMGMVTETEYQTWFKNICH